MFFSLVIQLLLLQQIFSQTPVVSIEDKDGDGIAATGTGSTLANAIKSKYNSIATMKCKKITPTDTFSLPAIFKDICSGNANYPNMN